MSRQIEITFLEEDASASFKLLDEAAPTASELLWQVLETPLVTRAVHAIYAGPAVLAHIPERHGEPKGGQIPVENETQRPETGDVLLLPPADEEAEDIWGEPGTEPGVTLAVFYGDQGRPFSPSGWQPGVVVGKIIEGLGGLGEACRAVRFKGARRICIAREECVEQVKDVVMHSDGASLGNPGPAGAGFVIKSRAGRTLAEGSVPLEPTTVNVAEYRGLIDGLLEAQRIGARRVHALMDSQLIVRQLTGEYRVKAEHLRPLYQWASNIISSFDAFKCEHVAREKNERADELAGEAAKRSKEQHKKR
jgi:ribonuclease HI